jgi:hypothetical protein
MRRKPTVFGLYAPGPRLTFAGACLIAVALSVPVFLGLTLIGWAF